MRKRGSQRFLDRQDLGTTSTVAVVAVEGLATQMTSDSDQARSEVEQRGSNADQSTLDADQAEYMAKTKPTRTWPNALQAIEEPPTAEI